MFISVTQPMTKTMTHKTLLLTAVITTILSACTWVPLETHGATVEVAAADQNLRTCEKLAETTVSVKDEVWFVDRNRGKVAEELENLARNEAAERNGDTIQAITEPREGEQRFGVYDCLK